MCELQSESTQPDGERQDFQLFERWASVKIFIAPSVRYRSPPPLRSHRPARRPEREIPV